MTLELTGDVHVARSTHGLHDDLYDDLASALAHAAAQAVCERGVFHLALSGGSTPEPFYIRLVIDPRYRGIPWKQTHVWVVDERRVPADDDRANIKLIRETLTEHVPMRQRQVHPMPVLEENAAALYEDELGRVLMGHEPGVTRDPHQPPRLDFVLLGMGDDAHTASLFPHSPALDVTDHWVAVNAGPRVTPPDRLTMTFPLLNAARDVAVLVTGEKKAATLARVDEQLRTGPDVAALPITGIDPEKHGGGDLTWYLDPAAAGEQTGA